MARVIVPLMCLLLLTADGAADEQDLSKTKWQFFKRFVPGTSSGYKRAFNYTATTGQETILEKATDTVVVSGDGFVCGAGIEIQLPPKRNTTVSFLWRVTTGFAGSAVTNFRCQVIRKKDDQVIEDTKLVWGGSTDTGWKPFLRDFVNHTDDPHLVRLTINDSWIANWRQSLTLGDLSIQVQEATQPPSSTATPTEIKALMVGLGHPVHHVRSRLKLLRLGKAMVGALETASQSDDPETSQRAKLTLQAYLQSKLAIGKPKAKTKADKATPKKERRWF